MSKMAPKNARNASTDDQHDAQSLQAAYQEIAEREKAVQLEREALLAWQQQWQQHYQQREANVARRDTNVAHREASVKERAYASETVRHNPYQLPKAVCLNRKAAALQREKRAFEAEKEAHEQRVLEEREAQEQRDRDLSKLREAQEQERRALEEEKEAQEQQRRALKEEKEDLDIKSRDVEHRSAIVEVLGQHHEEEARKLQKKEASVMEHDKTLRRMDRVYHKAMRKAAAIVRREQMLKRRYQFREGIVSDALNENAAALQEGYNNGSLSVWGACELANRMLRQVQEGFDEHREYAREE